MTVMSITSSSGCFVPGAGQWAFHSFKSLVLMAALWGGHCSYIPPSGDETGDLEGRCVQISQLPGDRSRSNPGRLL